MSIAVRSWHGRMVAPVLACSILVACGDDDSGENPGSDGSVADAGGSDGAAAPNIDGGVDSGMDATAPLGSDASIGAKTLRAEISPVGNDAFFGVTYDSEGNIFAAGKTAVTAGSTADSAFVLAKFTSAGVLDTTFGIGGYATKNVVEGGGSVEQGRGVVVQASGKLVVAGYAEHQLYAADAGAGLLANDTDIFVVRFNANGTLDTTFGTGGVVRHDIGTAYINVPGVLPDGGVPASTLVGADQPWSLAQTVDGKLVIHTPSMGVAQDGGVRTDTDQTLVRLTAEGALDTSFGSTGVVRTDLGGVNANARGALVLDNGSVIGTGYSGNRVLGGTTNATNPVIYKVNADGTPDTSFATKDFVATPGVWHDYARSDMGPAEAYGAALQGTSFVTLGYGNGPTSTTSDWIFLRFSADGTQDKTFGTTSGVTFLDPGGFGDNGRAVVSLPDNRVVGVGSGRPGPANPDGGVPGQDTMVGILQPNGQPDTTFGTGGIRLFDFGSTTEVLWGAAVSPSKKQVVAVGVAGPVNAGEDDDGAIVVLTLP
jgi:uncharacterized delta-60 repeat protein